MLASFLPGLRDLRAPFVSGVLVLVTLALVGRGTVESATSEGGSSQALEDLVRWVGRPGLGAVLSLAAYLVGSLVVGLTRGAVKGVNRKALNAMAERAGLRHLETTDGSEIWDWLGEVMNTFDIELAKWTRHAGWARQLAPIFPFTYDSAGMLASAFQEHVGSTLPRRNLIAPPTTVLIEAFVSGPRRLRLASTDLFGEVDRLISEAELRDALFVPLPIATFAILSHLRLPGFTPLTIMLVVLMLVVVLFGQARRSDREAYSLLLGALADHTFSTASLDRIGWTSPAA